MFATETTIATEIAMLANETTIRETCSSTVSNCRADLEREIVLDGDHRYELNGDDSRTLATVGAFRVVAERDLRDPRDESTDPRDRTSAICGTKV